MSFRVPMTTPGGMTLYPPSTYDDPGKRLDWCTLVSIAALAAHATDDDGDVHPDVLDTWNQAAFAYVDKWGS